tara:strand:- start:43709 stop:44314 length:606 start_codon:yes stop_codon:yes gene_type:complete
MQNHLIIFIKNPVLGTVKTRLAMSIGDEKALEVYNDLIQKCQEETLKVECTRHLFYSKNISENDSWLIADFEKEIQADGDLGDKITSAFYNVFKEKEKEKEKVIIIGSDCYDLDAATINEAFEKLDHSDVVIGPANDGGYYLLGINDFHPELLQNITWSTEDVLAETIERANSKKLSMSLLKELIDLDTLEDLEKSGYSLR